MGAGADIDAATGTATGVGVDGVAVTGEEDFKIGERPDTFGFAFFSAVLRGIAGRFPAAFALNPGGGWSIDTFEPPESGVTWFEVASGIGDTARCIIAFRDPAEPTSRDPLSEVVDDCELILLGRSGRLFAPPEDATNFLVGPVFFLAGDADDTRTSFPIVAVLPEEGMSLSLSSSSADSWGERKRAVGRGPDDEGPLAFLRMGCDGGGLEALEERLFKEALAEGVGSTVLCDDGCSASTAAAIACNKRGGTCVHVR